MCSGNMALREVEGIGWDKIKDYFESQAEELNSSMGVLEPVKGFEQDTILRGRGVLRTMNLTTPLGAARRHL